MNEPDRPYFQLEQARQVAEVFARHHVEYMFIGKGGAIILGYPAATQDVDLFPKKSRQNGQNIVEALRELEFELDDSVEKNIIDGVDFVQLKTGPFDLDLVFAPDGIESFEAARERMIVIDSFPVANIRDIIASKKASGREKDHVDLPLLEDFQEELEKAMRREPKSAVEIAMRRTEPRDETQGE
jgi:hypothetical protein